MKCSRIRMEGLFVPSSSFLLSLFYFLFPLSTCYLKYTVVGNCCERIRKGKGREGKVVAI